LILIISKTGKWNTVAKLFLPMPLKVLWVFEFINVMSESTVYVNSSDIWKVQFL
jgi:hypothetical protein